MAVQWLGFRELPRTLWVQCLIGELRSHKPCGMAKNVIFNIFN